VEHKPGSKNTAADYLSRRPYKPEQEEGEQNPRELEDIPDPREIIEITFGDSIIKQVDNLEENVYIQDDTLDENKEDIIENQETETENDKTQLYEMDEQKTKRNYTATATMPIFQKHLQFYEGRNFTR
jgi:hypothetical protein